MVNVEIYSNLLPIKKKKIIINSFYFIIKDNAFINEFLTLKKISDIQNGKSNLI